MERVRAADASVAAGDATTEADMSELMGEQRARRALTETLPSAAAFAAWEFISGPLALTTARCGGSAAGKR